MPATDRNNPAITLAPTYADARIHCPSSIIFAVSHPKLENVVYPPKNPTAIAIRQSGEMTIRFNVNCAINPRKKQPVKFTSNVP
jgi:hypothetical protein